MGFRRWGPVILFESHVMRHQFKKTLIAESNVYGAMQHFNTRLVYQRCCRLTIRRIYPNNGKLKLALVFVSIRLLGKLSIQFKFILKLIGPRENIYE